jgi:hypothetical protein
MWLQPKLRSHLFVMNPLFAVLLLLRNRRRLMRSLFFIVALVIIYVIGGVNAFGQGTAAAGAQADAGITPNRVIGEVKAIDAAAKQMIVKTDAGSVVTVNLSEATSYLRLPPGETTMAKAAKITFAEVAEGDRVLAMGKVADDLKSVPARALVVMTKADIAKMHEQERAEWRKRGILGVIQTLKPDTKEITITTRTAMGQQPVIMPVSDKVEMKRYAPDSIKFSDAKKSTFEELKVGDQLRALGEKSADGTHFTPEKIVTGSFQMVAGTVKAVDAATGEIKVNDMQTKKDLTIVVKSDSVLRKFPAAGEGGGMFMRGAGGAGGGQGAQAQGGAPAGNKPTQGSGGPPNAGGGGQGGGGMRGNIQDMLDRLPTISIADLKAGDTIIVSSTKGADPTRLTAITLVNGAETLLTMLAPRQQPGQAAPNPAAGLGTGITFGIGLP